MEPMIKLKQDTDINSPMNKELDKTRRIREIFGCDDDLVRQNRQNKSKLNYNETIFFHPQSKNSGLEEKDNLSHFINNVINSNMHNKDIDKVRDSSKPQIKLNVNINNNFYNSNYNYMGNTNNDTTNTKEMNKKSSSKEGGFTSFFSKLTLFIFRKSAWF